MVSLLVTSDKGRMLAYNRLICIKVAYRRLLLMRISIEVKEMIRMFKI